MLPFFLQGLDSDVEACQSDTVVKIEPITDLLVDMLARSGDLFIACLAGVRDPLTEIVDFRRIVQRLGYRQKQPADIGRFFDRANIGPSKGNVGSEKFRSMMTSWSSTFRVMRMLKSATTVIRISSPTAMPKILIPMVMRMRSVLFPK